MCKEAVLLVGHGSRLPEANDSLGKLVSLVAGKRPGTKVTYAFMQFASPSLPAALQELACAGMQQVTVVPIFLYAGVHIREDLPQILSEAAEKFPDLRVILAPVLGIDERMADIVWERVDAAPQF